MITHQNKNWYIVCLNIKSYWHSGINVFSIPTMVMVFLFLFSVNSASSRPEIVDAILPEVKQQGQTAYLNCSVINLQAPAAVSRDNY